MRTAMAGLLVTLLAGCQTPVGTINYEYGPAAPLSGFGRDYQWMSLERPAPENTRLTNPELHQLIHREIEKNLADRGYVQGSPPAFHVTYDVSTKYRVMKPGWDPVPYEEGALVVYLVEPGSGQLMWSGSVQVELDEHLASEQRRTRIQKGVAQLLANLEPYGG